MSDLVTGVGGFIGHHLVRCFEAKDHRVRGAELKASEHEPSAAADLLVANLRAPEACRCVVEGGRRLIRSDDRHPLKLDTGELVPTYRRIRGELARAVRLAPEASGVATF